MYRSCIVLRVNGAPFATLTHPTTNLDLGKGLVADGILLFEKRRERKLAKLVRTHNIYWENWPENIRLARFPPERGRN